jgi:hypothetical protein
MLFGRPHQHTREAIAVYHYNPTIFAPPTSTVVLWRCPPCRSVDSQTLTGKWTLQQIPEKFTPTRNASRTTGGSERQLRASCEFPTHWCAICYGAIWGTGPRRTLLLSPDLAAATAACTFGFWSAASSTALIVTAGVRTSVPSGNSSTV